MEHFTLDPEIIKYLLKMKSELYKLIEKMVRFPNATVCRHYVCLEILNVLESNGEELDINLVNAILDGSNGDKEVLKILEGKNGIQ